MILQTTKSVVDTNIKNESSTFTIKTSAKAFQILSNSLYKDKIKAVVRELSCNAYDAHVAANKKDIPFDVHLPSSIESFFSVKDYGVGLSEEDIFTLYTTYFDSTKTDSNEYVGALGLGSKSPFAYTDSFSITSIYNGTKTFYTAFINEEQLPCILKVDSISTEESNGIEVLLAVKKEDIDQFIEEAELIYAWFDVKPNFNIEFSVTTDIVAQYENWFKVKKQNESYIIQGQVCYPLNNNIIEKLISRCYIKVPIGTFDITPSREELSLTKRTLNILSKIIKETNESMQKYCETLEEKLDKTKDVYDQYFDLQKELSIFTRSDYLLEKFIKKNYENETLTLLKDYDVYGKGLNYNNIYCKKNYTKPYLFEKKYTLIFKDKRISLNRLKTYYDNIILFHNEENAKKSAENYKTKYYILSEICKELPKKVTNKYVYKRSNNVILFEYSKDKNDFLVKKEYYSLSTKIPSHAYICKYFNDEQIKICCEVLNRDATVIKCLNDKIYDILNNKRLNNVVFASKKIYQLKKLIDRRIPDHFEGQENLDKDTILYKMLEIRNDKKLDKLDFIYYVSNLSMSQFFPICNYLSESTVFVSSVLKELIPYFNTIKGDLNEWY